eukprot:3048080-Pleurochrysis_carterae.AAC.1
MDRQPKQCCGEHGRRVRAEAAEEVEAARTTRRGAEELERRFSACMCVVGGRAGAAARLLVREEDEARADVGLALPRDLHLLHLAEALALLRRGTHNGRAWRCARGIGDGNKWFVARRRVGASARSALLSQTRSRSIERTRNPYLARPSTLCASTPLSPTTTTELTTYKTLNPTPRIPLRV